MNPTEFIYKQNNPENVSQTDTDFFVEIINKYPYFQSARALNLKSLHAQRSYLYNNELKKTAAYTTDRDVLFDFIISDDFIRYRPINLEEVDVYDEMFIKIKKPEPTLEENIEKSILSTIAYIEDAENDDQIISQLEAKTVSKVEKNTSDQLSTSQSIEEKLEIGKPLAFEENEKHSFSEWLKLTKAKPIEREDTFIEEKNLDESNENETSPDVTKQKKLELIDRFIEANPKITPSRNPSQNIINIDKTDEDSSLLMTETLAKIYLEQKKYQKATQAYQILILKYPEKSVLFAERIEDIKALQQYNN